MKCFPGAREDLLEVLTRQEGMPGCLRYIVARDENDEDAIWVTEIWESAEDHLASLELPEVVDAISLARPLIAGFDVRATTEPVNGIGFPSWPPQPPA
jgi:quinol monooxygenase YgiN